ncbi:uncharacterized protein LOC123448937 isoform X2 [Hordeum vulgare subsp. vulgare]|uniref:uncharacterized protein LOC123448937 isoform X2 n=1 Tax=Hordeum vulgare subsp. vulgare TaxID=112509 RepID=UPI001D1A58EB|nr:uncharacterized protein LOC123448937 isoform X2 [Hordeum vulgare subsp. vulgare]
MDDAREQIGTAISTTLKEIKPISISIKWNLPLTYILLLSFFSPEAPGGWRRPWGMGMVSGQLSAEPHYHLPYPAAGEADHGEREEDLVICQMCRWASHEQTIGGFAEEEHGEHPSSFTTKIEFTGSQKKSTTEGECFNSYNQRLQGEY